MKGNSSYHVDTAKERALHTFLEGEGFHFFTAPYAFWRASGKDITLTFFLKGNLLIQAKDTGKMVNDLIEKGFIEEKQSPKPRLSSWVGTDEAGKGDYFGPLVVAGVLVTKKTSKELFTTGVKDSKNLSDSTIKELAKKVKRTCPHAIITIMPEAYNRLMRRMRNLNRLLAWGHARAIENILEKESCTYAISDQFGDERYIIQALMKKGKHITLKQRPHAEEDIAVAAASILARNEFVEKIEDLSRAYQVLLPKGASAQVIAAGEAFIEKSGEGALSNVAKLHFKTTKQIIANQ